MNLNKWYSLDRTLRIFAIIIAAIVLTCKCYSHVHVEIDVPEGTWENIERHEQQEAYDKFQSEPEKCSEKEMSDAYEHEIKNSA